MSGMSMSGSGAMGFGVGVWGYQPGIYVPLKTLFFFFFFFFLQFELSHFFRHFSEWIEGTLCAQHLIQFNTNTFETLQTS